MRSKLLLFLAAALLGFLSMSCNPPTAPTPVPPSTTVICVDNACNVVNPPGGGGGGPGASDCQNVGSVKVKLDGEGDRNILTVGENLRMDATAFNRTTGQQIFTTCGITWKNSNTAACDLFGELSTYNPRIRAVAKGSCRITAQPGNGEGFVDFLVQ